MLPKKERLTRADFNRFFSLGRRHNTPNLQLVHYPHNTLHASVVVSKKVANTAAGRNKIRRRIYDIIRNLKYKSEPVGIFIIIVRPGAKTMSYEALKEEVVGLVGRTDKTR